MIQKYDNYFNFETDVVKVTTQENSYLTKIENKSAKSIAFVRHHAEDSPIDVFIQTDPLQKKGYIVAPHKKIMISDGPIKVITDDLKGMAEEAESLAWFKYDMSINMKNLKYLFNKVSKITGDKDFKNECEILYFNIKEYTEKIEKRIEKEYDNILHDDADEYLGRKKNFEEKLVDECD